MIINELKKQMPVRNLLKSMKKKVSLMLFNNMSNNNNIQKPQKYGIKLNNNKNK